MLSFHLDFGWPLRSFYEVNKLRFLILGLLLASSFNLASAQQGANGPVYVQIKVRYQYPGTDLVSEAGTVELAVGKTEKAYVLRAPGAKTVAIPKNLVQIITAEAAAHALLAEREATSLKTKQILLQLQMDRLRDAQAAAHGAVANPVVNPLDALEGGRLVADDGTFLGIVSRNQMDANSISNEFGQYGNDLSQKSIFNDLGPYGGDLSPMSPFNDLSIKPPKIITRNGKWIFLTANDLKAPRVDPQILIAWLKGG